jgi:hypothetical protein
MVVELLHNKLPFGNDLKTYTTSGKKCNWALNIGVRLIFRSYLRRYGKRELGSVNHSSEFHEIRHRIYKNVNHGSVSLKENQFNGTLLTGIH